MTYPQHPPIDPELPVEWDDETPAEIKFVVGLTGSVVPHPLYKHLSYDNNLAVWFNNKANPENNGYPGTYRDYKDKPRLRNVLTKPIPLDHIGLIN